VQVSNSLCVILPPTNRLPTNQYSHAASDPTRIWARSVSLPAFTYNLNPKPFPAFTYTAFTAPLPLCLSESLYLPPSFPPLYACANANALDAMSSMASAALLSSS
jgi:hypothetical protein